eukprot:TRINITY_DN3980_c0_g1_i1.p2 TRINITY_DN3980_c0_g1~~TRINITY_DN3980_c0_g1_i1.p2  ORF type:complete len:275 (-),score=56.94 TRINITY_DN3980_c0_g1_i1:428-1252(-)
MVQVYTIGDDPAVQHPNASQSQTSSQSHSQPQSHSQQQSQPPPATGDPIITLPLPPPPPEDPSQAIRRFPPVCFLRKVEAFGNMQLYDSDFLPISQEHLLSSTADEQLKNLIWNFARQQYVRQQYDWDVHKYILVGDPTVNYLVAWLRQRGIPVSRVLCFRQRGWHSLSEEAYVSKISELVGQQAVGNNKPRVGLLELQWIEGLPGRGGGRGHEIVYAGGGFQSSRRWVCRPFLVLLDIQRRLELTRVQAMENYEYYVSPPGEYYYQDAAAALY